MFGYAQFRGKQEEVVRQVMSGVDTIAVMPTGAGKSLCYQLPAMLLPGMTVVISPLIALMKDQYDSLPAGVYEKTTFINSSLEGDVLGNRMDEILRGKYKLVYARRRDYGNNRLWTRYGGQMCRCWWWIRRIV